MHLVPLFYEPAQCAPHCQDGIVGVRAEGEHAFGVGCSALGAVGVVGIRLASWPPGDGVLQVVEDLYVYVISRAIDCHQFAQAIFVVVFVGELEDGFAGLLTKPHQRSPEQDVVPVARCHLPGILDAGEA